MSVTSEPFGSTAAGHPVERYTLRAGSVEARVITYGATLVALRAPDRSGTMADVVLGFDSLAPYLRHHPYLGSLVGRFANRIAGGRFSLDGASYQLPVNNGPNHLHGGPGGFHAVLWQAEAGDDAVRLRYHSPDGEQGYPGALDVSVTYTLGADGALRLDYEARCDRATILNLTNHAYFNLAGSGNILGHKLQISADHFLPVDATLIPTGELRPVEGTPLDFRAPTPIGARINADEEQLRQAGGYDHCYVLNHGGDLGVIVARAVDPLSGRVLEVRTTQPGVQFYSGNFLDGSLRGRGGQPYARHCAFCLETQHFPDSPNQPAFPSTVLRPGEIYRHSTIYRLTAESPS
ncbi:MAG: galactose mutarotase [Chloroflexi bacterium OHK40]